MAHVERYLAEVAKSAALECGAYLRGVFRRTMTVDTKTNFHDPVTVHDKHVEGMLHRILGYAVPGCHILGEETGEHVLKEPTAAPDNPVERIEVPDPDRLRWIVDPIDGTANFAAGRGYFCTSIAAEYRGKLVASAIYAPYTGELFWADDNQAWVIEGQNAKRIYADGPSSEDTALIAWYPTFVTNNEQYLDLAVTCTATVYRTYATVRTPGAVALDLAYVAAGFSGAATGNRTRPWDVAAGYHLVKTAGGKVYTFDIDDTLPPHLQGAFVACGPNLYPRTALENVGMIVQRQPREI